MKIKFNKKSKISDIQRYNFFANSKYIRNIFTELLWIAAIDYRSGANI